MPQEVEDNSEIVNENEESFLQQLNSKTHVDTSANEDTPKNHRFYYSVGDFNLLLEQELKAENISPTKIYELPHPPSWCVGIVNVRGVIVPVVDMHILFKTKEKTSAKKSKYLLLQHESLSPIILQIDKLPSMIDFDDYSFEEAIEKSHNWLIKQFQYKSNTIYEVSHNDILKQLPK